MSLGPDDLRHVADLARLAVDEAELVPLSEEVGRILDFVSRLQARDLAAEPDALPAAEGRPDIPAPSDAEAVLAEAPALDDRLFAIPRILP